MLNKDNYVPWSSRIIRYARSRPNGKMIVDFTENGPYNVKGNGKNQVGLYAGQVAQNQQGFNAWQNGGMQGAQNTSVQSGGNQNGLVVVPRIANQCGTGNHASTSGTQHDRAPVYDTDSSAEVHLNDNYYDNEIFNMFTQEEQYTDLLEPIPEPQLVPQNDNHVTSVAPSMVQNG
nr:hypothetical protein [Tanacetum cinerariifolium]